MRKLFFASILTVCAGSVFAQNNAPYQVVYESVNVTEIVGNRYGPYLTNGFWDNWFIGAGAGIGFFEGGNKGKASFGDRLAPSLDVSVGKWLTPSTGVRLQYNGLQGVSWTNVAGPYTVKQEGDNKFKQKFNYSFVHADFLWNVSNAWGGYREDRFWNFIPYVGFGWARSWKNGERNNELAATVGLLNTMRLGEVVDLTLELKQMMVKNRFDGVPNKQKFEGMTSLTAGISFKLGRKGFSRPVPPIVPNYAPYKQRINKLENQLEKRDMQIDTLTKALAAARKPVQKVEVQPVVIPDMAIFFAIGKSAITPQDMINIGNYAKIIKQYPKRQFFITGYADNKTGTPAINEKLSLQRAESVRDALVNQFGVNPGQLVVRSKGGVSMYSNPKLDRVVKIE